MDADKNKKVLGPLRKVDCERLATVAGGILTGVVFGPTGLAIAAIASGVLGGTDQIVREKFDLPKGESKEKVMGRYPLWGVGVAIVGTLSTGIVPGLITGALFGLGGLAAHKATEMVADKMSKKRKTGMQM